MKQNSIIQNKIDQFKSLINDGIESWIKAGEILVELVDSDQGIYDAIVARNPQFTYETLSTFEAIGRKEIYPYLLLDGSHGAKKLMEMPYSRQVELYDTTVEVVVDNGGKLVVEKIKVQDLKKAQCDLVFGHKSLRKADQQIEFLKEKRQVRSYSFMPYEIKGGKIYFRSDSVLTREELEKIIASMPKAIDSLEDDMKSNQIRKKLFK